MIELEVTDRSHLRWGSGRPVFRKKVQDWMEEKVGIHGVAWHLRIGPPNGAGSWRPVAVYLCCGAKEAMLFKLTWL